MAPPHAQPQKLTQGPLVTLAVPQPYEELPHPADLRIRVCGENPPTTLALLALAHAQLLAGGGTVGHRGDEMVIAPPSKEPVLVAIDVLRELHARFVLARHIAHRVTVHEFGAGGARLTVAFGLYDPGLHAEGFDIKAVTYHGASFVPAANGYVAEVVFDV